ncbi:putative NAD(P)H nitroreductase YdjA [Meiothermus luteus]|uniref:Putative NAD(P)H nitroreductase YdjA n=1 Tax=Meiothermus luteus TaxID=2026184 RepID=A0A399EY43_9DEIN|nr:nitroreductase family protein [Meiothermus luteus]RIH87211.1 putative NAD(P)H nitroreductase YdjA [Meiothermus luteus]RMH54215.1 MAG: DUF2470 domain-containing protein [Deinococcota bacterium]
MTTTDLTPERLSAYLEHINDDHAEELLATIKALGGPEWAEGAEMTALGPEGFTALVWDGEQSARFEHRFAEPARDALHLREMLVALMSRPQPAHRPYPSFDADALEAIIRGRRSYGVQALKPDPVPRALIERCLDAARYAPNNGRTHPFRFVVITGPEAKQRLWAKVQEVFPKALPGYEPRWLESYRKLIFGAPVWIAIGMQPRRERPMPEWEELAAVSMAVQNLHLMAAAQGLGGLWASGPVATHPDLAAYFGWAEPPDRLLGLFYMGFAKRALAPRKYPSLESLVRWEED